MKTEDISICQKIGLYFIQLGAHLYFRNSVTLPQGDTYLNDLKLNKIKDEVNGETLLGCQITAGGHGYNTDYAPVINLHVAASLRNVLLNARKYFDPYCDLSSWGKQAKGSPPDEKRE